MQRLTISLDDDLAAALDRMQDATADSKATLVRRALKAFVKQDRGSDRPTDFDQRVWADLLANREHVILDVAHVKLLFEQCADAPPEFWQELRQIGVEHGRQYKDRGIRRVEDVLRIIESANWFHVSPEAGRSWALIVIDPTTKRYLKTFLGGFFSEYPGKPEIVEERTKLRVRLTAQAPLAAGAAEPA